MNSQEPAMTNPPSHRSATTPDPEIIYVDKRRVACDGGGGPLGHPKVYYSLEDGEAQCLYCDRKFVYAPDKAGAA